MGHRKFTSVFMQCPPLGEVIEGKSGRQGTPFLCIAKEDERLDENSFTVKYLRKETGRPVHVTHWRKPDKKTVLVFEGEEIELT